LITHNEVLKFQNAGFVEEIANLRKVNRDISELNWKRYESISNLKAELSQVSDQFAAYKEGAQAFQKLAELQIINEAAVSTDLKLKLLNTTTAIVYGEAKRDHGV